MAYIRASKHKELKPENLRWKCDPDVFESESTNQLKPIEGIVGQERAIKAIKLGVDLRSQGYNIFITGLSGTGKFTTVKKMLQTISPECTSIFDYAYVNNFQDPDRPILLTFPAGRACKFKNDLTAKIKFLQDNIPQVLDSNPFVSQRQKLINQFNSTQQKMKEELEKRLTKDNFTLGQVKVGEMLRPEILVVIEDKAIFVQQLDEFVLAKKLTKRKANQIVKKYGEYQEELHLFFMKNLKLSQEFQQKLIKLEEAAVDEIVKVTIEELKEEYPYAKVNTFLDQICASIPDYLSVFKGQKPAQEDSGKGYIVDYLKDFEVNIILDNTGITECPVVVETSPTYSNLFGTIERSSDGSGGWYADFTKIKAGSLLRANGGYLVINAVDTFTEPGVWRVLKRVLLHGRLEIQDPSNIFQFAPSILKPEAIEINTKIIFIGNNYIYSVLSNYEDDFNKIFKVKAEFDYEMKRTDTALIEYARIVKKLINEENLLEFDKTGLAAIAEHGARYAGEQNKLTARFAYIADIVRESSFWAKDNGSEVVADYHVNQAYHSYRERYGLHESKLGEMIEDGTILIDTKGSRVGQVNGLAVYGSGPFYFGKPSRITATVSLGNGNILNVEREAGLSGSTHDKGVLIISGYLRETFGNKIPLSFNANLVFEQGYGTVDGDSASITEIAAIISCLSGVPIKQSLAITGSVNQKGDIQPIGGVNEKIEGFFETCSKKDPDGKNGVIIPAQNVKDLMLNDSVIEAVKANKFHIYPVSRVEEAIEILTGVKAGEKLKSGWYQSNTVFGSAEKRLKEMRKLIKPVEEKNGKRKSRK